LRNLCVVNRSVIRLFILVAVAVMSTSLTAGVVGSGTPTSCTQSALQAQLSGGGTVTFNCGAGQQSISITSPLGVISSFPPVTVDGNDTITLDGTGTTSGMLNVYGSDTALGTLTLKHITFTHGDISTGLNAGGTIQNFGNLTLDTVTITKSHGPSSGAAIFQELCNGCLTASLTVKHSLFQNNAGDGGGSAISVQGGLASITDSTFSGNSGSLGGAIELYGNSTFKVIVSIDRSTFTGNSSTFGGGAIAIESLNPGSNVTITNDTFTANTATGSTAHGAALYIASAPVTIRNCTIAGNTATATGGAVYFDSVNPVTWIANTIVASNSGGNCSLAPGALISGGNNLQFGDTTCTGMTVANPLLGPLANNGGLTQTMALGAGSPAIDHGDTINAPTTDQRGVARTDGNGDGIIAVDIGAFEAPALPGNGTPAPRRHRAVKP
jgi:predicted outer membrane repeat protein